MLLKQCRSRLWSMKINALRTDFRLGPLEFAGVKPKISLWRQSSQQRSKLHGRAPGIAAKRHKTHQSAEM
jgi:hypothetical protein